MKDPNFNGLVSNLIYKQVTGYSENIARFYSYDSPCDSYYHEPSKSRLVV